MTRAWMVFGLVLSLGLPAWWVRHAERVSTEGEVVILELAPRDPRSLIQGDYMVLRYRLAADLHDTADWPRTGVLAVTVDERDVVTGARRLATDDLRPDERRLVYRLRAGRIRLGAESWFFQEGLGDHYAQARFGELRVDASGAAFLVGLRDADLVPLDPEPESAAATR